MAQKKTKGGSKRKAASKSKPQYYVVETVQKARQNIADKMDSYNQTFICKPMESGKTLLNDFKTEPRKTIGSLVDDGKDYIVDLQKDTMNKVETMVKDGKTFVSEAGQHPRKTIRSLADDGKELMEKLGNNTRNRFDSLVDDYKSMVKGLGQDTRLVVDELTNSSKKAFDNVPGKQRLEKEINSRMQKIPALLNLPSKKEMDGLVRRVKKLNTSVEALSKSYAG